jgi:hypothetical protein
VTWVFQKTRKGTSRICYVYAEFLTDLAKLRPM